MDDIGTEGTTRMVTIENAYMASLIAQLVEALAIATGAPDYADMTLDERLQIGRDALELVPQNIGKRRRGLGVDLSERLMLPDHVSVHALGFNPTLVGRLNDAQILTVGDLRRMPDAHLRTRAHANKREIEDLRAIIPANA